MRLPTLFAFQEAIVAWAYDQQRSAIFADCGLGKTPMQLAWLRKIGGVGLIMAPLAVAQQTRYEARKFGWVCHYVRDHSEINGPGLYVTNYEMADHFPAAGLKALVLDESSILKSWDGKTRTRLIEQYQDVPYRLCCTATPAPNDVTELGNHSEFLGVMPRAEMLATFFVHDDTTWRLKGWAEEPFYEWLASWSMMFGHPSQLGFSDNGYRLPPLSVEPITVPVDMEAYARCTGRLFVTGLAGLEGRLAARRLSLNERISKAAAILNDSGEQWVVWCGLNEESQQLVKCVPDAVGVEGTDALGDKVHKIGRFLDKSTRVLITKVRIGGFGLNLQGCHNVMFMGLSDSYEQYYQAIRRCYRFGQESPVRVVILISDLERTVLDNVLQKEEHHKNTIDRVAERVAEHGRAALRGDARSKEDVPALGSISTPEYQIANGDCMEIMPQLEAESVDFAVFSPPFLSLYSYTADSRDMGNTKTTEAFDDKYRLFGAELFRLMRPGRLVATHVAQVPAKKAYDGFIGLKDFRGLVIAAMVDAGFVYHGDITVDKNPQAQAVRTHSKALLFKQLKKDASWLRPGLADYVLLFRKPGEPEVVIQPDISNEDWIKWAHPVWYDIRESDTLNTAEARTEKDEKHIAPLQLSLIERCIRLWSNPGEVVFSPFMGIGSEGYVALKQNRRFMGIELKPEYYQTGAHNLERALGQRSQLAMPLGS
tara:strand:- start:249 stop:2378 length:2130 start_codon:yes stop_codon:yes gene_type:complete